MLTPHPPLADRFRERVRARQAVVGILGLGYVGLPLAMAFAERGFTVLGFDVDPAKVAALARGECYLHHLGAERLRAAMAAGPFTATADFGRLGEPDALLVCVPTPLTAQREPDLSYVVDTTEAIAARLRPGQLVILESTTYPGTTEEVVAPRLAATGLRLGEEVFVAYSPEREDPGNARFSTTTTPKVVAGLDAAAGDMAQALYDQVVGRTVRVSTTRAAEAAKLTENVFRAVNIALVNELKVVYDRMGIDIWEVLDAAATKPFGFMRFDPGPGWGGHCIPLDPFYLSWKAREHGVTPHFIERAGEVNREMPAYVIEKLTLALNRRRLAVHGSRVLVLGLSYKADIDDTRESPAFILIDRLLELGAEVTYHDPLVPVAPRVRSRPNLPPMTSRALTAETLGAVDAVLLVTRHTAVDYALIAEHAPLIVDTRGVYQHSSDPKIVRA
jgi:UDP-N-acetyl-D-glucosamine dehydrogenase